MRIIISILLNALSLYIGTLVFPNAIQISSITAALIGGAVLGLANVTIRPLLKILTLPLTIVTLGLFLIVVNALVLLLVSALVTGLRIDGFGWAMVLAVLFALLNLLYEMLDLKR